MQTVLIELRDNKAFDELHKLEDKQLIHIVNDNESCSSYALPGKPLSVDDFRKWIEYTENTPTISLTLAKQQWQAQRKKLQQLIR